MGNRNYERGRRWEYKVKKEWEKRDYMVLRTAGSHGPFDLVAVKWGLYPSLIQCKVCSSVAEAGRLQREFLENPPLKPGGYYEQILQIHINGCSKLWESGVY